jgi:hypothetical protein
VKTLGTVAFKAGSFSNLGIAEDLPAPLSVGFAASRIPPGTGSAHLEICQGSINIPWRRMRVIYSGKQNLATYFVPDFFFAAQYAFNFADNLARVAVLITVFLAVGLAETVSDLVRRSLVHLAF